jgi:hypothetical protein
MSIEPFLKFATQFLLAALFFAFAVAVFFYPTKEQRRWYAPKLLNPWRLALRRFEGIEPQDRKRLAILGSLHLAIIVFVVLILLAQGILLVLALKRL